MTEREFAKYSTDRLGEAYVRLNTWKWDDIFGPKPEGYDQMTDHEKYQLPEHRKAFEQIMMHLSPAQKSMYWWTIGLGKTYDEWCDWFDEVYLDEKEDKSDDRSQNLQEETS